MQLFTSTQQEFFYDSSTFYKICDENNKKLFTKFTLYLFFFKTKYVCKYC